MANINWRAFAWHSKSMPPPTTSAKMDVTSLFFCGLCNMCLLRDDTFKEGEGVYCRKHGTVTDDVTNTPIGHAFREMIRPQPRIDEPPL